MFKIKEKYWLLTLLFLVGLMIFHYFLPIIQDDIYFAKHASEIFLLNGNNFLLYRVTHWTSRIITEFFLPLLAKNPNIWKVIDSLLFLLFAILLPKVVIKDYDELNDNKKFIYTLIGIILVIIFIYTNYYALMSAGFISTTLNYTWPFIFGLIHFYLVKNFILHKKNVSIFIYIASIFSLLFAINVEIMAVIMFGAYLLILKKYFYPPSLKKIKENKAIVIFVILTLIFIIFHLINPGNQERFAVELAAYGGDLFNSLSLFNKIDIASTSILCMTLLNVELVLYTFLGILGIYSYYLTKNKFKSLIISFPFIFYTIFLIISSIFNIHGEIFSIFTPAGLLSSTITKMSLLFIIFYAIIISILIYACIIIAQNKSKKFGFLIFFLLFLSFLSQSTISFTPSVMITGYPFVDALGRWWIIFNGIITILSALLIFDLLDNLIELPRFE